MERIASQPWSKTEGPLEVILETGSLDSFQIAANLLSVRIRQRVLRTGTTEMWNSVSVYCEEEPSGALVVRVIVLNPDWDGPLQIAAIRSWPKDAAPNFTVLGCNLDHVAP